ncbi:MAG: hypothetical protein ABJE66_13875 [Deltaproteobacteria bacterium]
MKPVCEFVSANAKFLLLARLIRDWPTFVRTRHREHALEASEVPRGGLRAALEAEHGADTARALEPVSVSNVAEVPPITFASVTRRMRL